MEEEIWFLDPKGLFAGDRPARFVPLANAPLAEQLNAVMRFAIYFAAVLLVLRRTTVVLYIPVLAGAVTYLVYVADAQAREARDADATEGREDGAPAIGRDPSSGKACVRPTRDNPFMNVLVTDYARAPRRPAACDVDNPRTQARIQANFDHNLYRDVDDVFQRRSSSRQFYTNPSTTIPNDQGGYAQWLYGSAPTCKEGSLGLCRPPGTTPIPGRL